MWHGPAASSTLWLTWPCIWAGHLPRLRVHLWPGPLFSAGSSSFRASGAGKEEGPTQGPSPK